MGSCVCHILFFITENFIKEKDHATRTQAKEKKYKNKKTKQINETSKEIFNGRTPSLTRPSAI